MRRRLVAVSLAALAFPLLAACGSGSTAGGIPENSPSATPTESASTAVVACDKSVKTVPQASAKVGSTPNIAKPSGPPPCTLIVKDLTVGSGAAVTDINKKYNWNYEGVSWSTGEVFDTSFGAAPVPFSLSQVIPGWTEGLKGMKVGGRRELVIPPAQGYGAQGSPPKIAPNETLVFVVDLVGPA